MKKIKLLLLVSISVAVLTSCGDKYSVKNLKKNEKLLLETVAKCKEKNDEKVCSNATKAQEELASEEWTKIKPEIEKIMKETSENIKNKNYSPTIKTLPPKLISNLAKKAQMDENKFKTLLISMMETVMKDAQVESQSEIDKAKIGRTSAGRTYAVVPSNLKVTMAGQTIDTKGYTLVFKDGKEWYEVNFDDRYLPALKEIYPDIAELDVAKLRNNE